MAGRVCPAVARTDPVSDDLWEAILPLLPPEPPRHHGGPPRVPHRAALGGILFVLRHGLRWSDLPQQLGYGSGVTCWRRLRQWQDLGIWSAVHQIVLNWLGDLDAIDWSRASIDSVSVRAKRGGEHTGPNPTDRGKRGSKYHVLVDRQGIPLAVQLTAANVHDSKLLEPLVDAVQPIRRPIGAPGRPRKRPAKLHADKGYDFPEKRRALRRRGITPRIARRGVESSERLGRYRWVVERTHAWVITFRKLTVRYDRHAATVLAFLHLACAVICLRFLAHAESDAH
jgi:transposase